MSDTVRSLRELDALVAEHVLGWVRLTCDDFEGGAYTLHPPDSMINVYSWRKAEPDALPFHGEDTTVADCSGVRRHSFMWADVGEVVTAMEAKGWDRLAIWRAVDPEYSDGQPWVAELSDTTSQGPDFLSYGPTRESAICLAALAALGHEVKLEGGE